MNNNPKRLVKIALVDDEPAVGDTLKEHFREAGPRFSLLPQIRDINAAIEQLPALSPDVLLTDILFARGSGVECVRRVAPLLPNTRILMLTVSHSPTHIFESLRAGAVGYVIKRDIARKLLPAIENVLAGHSDLSPSIARKIIDYFRQQRENPEVVDALTQRELEVLRAIAAGAPVKEVATQLGISSETVGKHLGNIYGKLHVHTRKQAVAKFRLP